MANYTNGLHVPDDVTAKLPFLKRHSGWVNTCSKILDSAIHSIIPVEIAPLACSLGKNLVELIAPSAFSDLTIRAEHFKDKANWNEEEVVVMKIRPTNNMPILGHKPKGTSMAAGFRSKKNMA